MKVFGVVRSFQFHNDKFYTPVEYKDGEWEPIGQPQNEESQEKEEA